MRILVVGCSGMLGTELVAAFGTGHEVEGIDLPRIDITDPGRCLAAAEDLKPEVIVNAAAFTRVDDCETMRDKALQVNGYGAGNLSAAAAASGALLVHYSSDYVFDGLKGEPYVEEDPPNPQSVYGQSKLLGEVMVRKHCPNHLIIRTSWLFGTNGPNFVRTIVGLARKGSMLRVVDDQRGSPTYAKDLAIQTVKMVEAGCRSTYHVTNSGSCTWFELASKAVEWSGMPNAPITPVSTQEFPRPAPRPSNSVLSNCRLAQQGLSIMRPWQSAVREYVEKEFHGTA
ncbi:MAG: dTDP-4-dehydrorhamnose reductase [Acidobacteria bacterium]|nr:dTDP-4-dehydrorhamnose reductase [Acidobacteriota bacterium]